MSAGLSGDASGAGTVLALGGVYVGQSILGGLVFLALPSILRERGLALDLVGLVSLVSLPWALKILWSQRVERYRLPPAGPARSRRIVFFCGAATLTGLVAVAFVDLGDWALLLGLFVAIAFAASTADIAADGHAVESLAVSHHGWANAAQVGGAYLGSAFGSGLFLVLVARFDWRLAVLLTTVLFAALLLPFLLSPPPPSRPREHQPSLRFALERPPLRAGLVLAAVYVVAMKWGVALSGPFLIDAGLDLAALGLVNGLGGLGVGFASALLGGALVRFWGAARVMLLALALQAAVLAALAFCDWHGGLPRALLAGLALAGSSGVMALGFVALYSAFMALADPRQAGIDFTLLQGVDALVSMAGGLGAGVTAQHLGYGGYFGVAALLALAVLPAVRWLMQTANLASHAKTP